jgi:hypothetical protein
MGKRLIIGGYSSMGKAANCTLQYYDSVAKSIRNGAIFE